MGATFPDVGQEAQLAGLFASPVRQGWVVVITLGGGLRALETPPGLLPCSHRGWGSACRSHVHFRVLLTSTCVKEDTLVVTCVLRPRLLSGSDARCGGAESPPPPVVGGGRYPRSRALVVRERL